ncbi:MAG: VTT domain-containing protein [Nanoarchaeota archaeon]|nr:VTT domain-containing protein [Nanoarchaeota archaeon]
MKKKFIFSILLLILIAVIFWSSLSLQTVFSQSVDSIEPYMAEHPIMGINIFIWFAALSAIFSFFSSIIIVPFVIPIWGKFWTLIFLTTGWFIGGLLAYAIGIFAGYPILKRIISLEEIEEYKAKLPENQTFWAIFLFRLVTPSEITSYILGILRYNFKSYLVITLSTELIFAVLTVYASDAILNNKPIVFAATIIALIIITSVIVFFVKRVKEIRPRLNKFKNKEVIKFNNMKNKVQKRLRK